MESQTEQNLDRELDTGFTPQPFKEVRSQVQVYRTKRTYGGFPKSGLPFSANAYNKEGSRFRSILGLPYLWKSTSAQHPICAFKEAMPQIQFTV